MGTKRRATKPGMGAVKPGARESSIPPAPVSCPAPDSSNVQAPPAGSKRRSTLRRQGSSPKTKKASSRPKIPPAEPPKPFEPSTGRYATVPERREEVLLAKSKPPARPTKTSLRATAAVRTTMRSSDKPKPKRVVPRIASTDLGKTKLGPRDAFLLSRIDGVLAIEDLADLTGMRESEILESLEQLAMLGLVRF